MQNKSFIARVRKTVNAPQNAMQLMSFWETKFSTALIPRQNETTPTNSPLPGLFGSRPNVNVHKALVSVKFAQRLLDKCVTAQIAPPAWLFAKHGYPEV